jgi:hypothetical protein
MQMLKSSLAGNVEDMLATAGGGVAVFADLARAIELMSDVVSVLAVVGAGHVLGRKGFGEHCRGEKNEDNEENAFHN